MHFLIETIKSTNICRTDDNNDGYDMQLYEQKLAFTLSNFKVIIQTRKERITRLLNSNFNVKCHQYVTCYESSLDLNEPRIEKEGAIKIKLKVDWSSC